MGHLSTHVLDTTRGKPGAGIKLVVQRLTDEHRETVSTAVTNNDGRCDNPLLEGDAFIAGEYEIQFAVGEYLKSAAAESNQPGDLDTSAGPRFLDTVVIRFGVQSGDEHYHVPLLISPFAYSTYRGS